MRDVYSQPERPTCARVDPVNIASGAPGCLAPANSYPADRARLHECYACGEDVCVECSQLVSYNGKRCRLCSGCLNERVWAPLSRRP